MRSTLTTLPLIGSILCALAAPFSGTRVRYQPRHAAPKN